MFEIVMLNDDVITWTFITRDDIIPMKTTSSLEGFKRECEKKKNKNKRLPQR